MSVAVIGSSVANGHSVDKGHSWYDIVAAESGIDFRKRCINGSTISVAIEQFEFIKDEVDSVILSFSVANEGMWVPWMASTRYSAIGDQFVRDTLDAHAHITRAKKRCFVIGIYPNGLYHGEQCFALDRIENTLSESLKEDYIQVLEPLGGCRWNSKYRTFLDPFHPNEAAHRIIADLVLKRIPLRAK